MSKSDAVVGTHIRRQCWFGMKFKFLADRFMQSDNIITRGWDRDDDQRLKWRIWMAKDDRRGRGRKAGEKFKTGSISKTVAPNDV